jgi:hypothetical protein
MSDYPQKRIQRVFLLGEFPLQVLLNVLMIPPQRFQPVQICIRKGSVAKNTPLENPTAKTGFEFGFVEDVKKILSICMIYSCRRSGST